MKNLIMFLQLLQYVDDFCVFAVRLKKKCGSFGNVAICNVKKWGLQNVILLHFIVRVGFGHPVLFQHLFFLSKIKSTSWTFWLFGKIVEMRRKTCSWN